MGNSGKLEKFWEKGDRKRRRKKKSKSRAFATRAKKVKRIGIWFISEN